MTTLREAAQAVLDRWDSPKWEWHQGPTAALMADLRAALKEPVQEPQYPPMTWAWTKERRPLTDEEMRQLWAQHGYKSSLCMRFARAIERAHGIGEQQ